ncbi:uncharacterized protein LOC141529806 isoform X2 [Cotesia typhae]|uniref:uncharacterized protein LOC141529806 isoform X2 n=1 Tax=Cotesia typhae TaxID=2053667 RepID=UPI003D6936CA
MYYVVFWDKTSAVVPASWVDSDSRTFKWAKTKNASLLIIRADNPKDNWITYNYVQLSGPFEAYDEARDFELDALNLSTNDDEGFTAVKTNKKLEMVEKRKRNCNKPLRYCDTEDESTPIQKKTKSRKRIISASSSSENEDSGINNIPMPPATYVSQKDQQLPPTFKTPISSHHSTSENQIKSSHSTYKSMSSFNNTNEKNTDNDLVEIPPTSLSQDPDSFRKDGAQSPRLNNDFDNIDIPLRIIRDHSR